MKLFLKQICCLQVRFSATTNIAVRCRNHIVNHSLTIAQRTMFHDYICFDGFLDVSLPTQHFKIWLFCLNGAVKYTNSCEIFKLLFFKSCEPKVTALINVYMNWILFLGVTGSRSNALPNWNPLSPVLSPRQRFMNVRKRSRKLLIKQDDIVSDSAIVQMTFRKKVTASAIKFVLPPLLAKKLFLESWSTFVKSLFWNKSWKFVLWSWVFVFWK